MTIIDCGSFPKESQSILVYINDVTITGEVRNVISASQRWKPRTGHTKVRVSSTFVDQQRW